MANTAQAYYLSRGLDLLPADVKSDKGIISFWYKNGATAPSQQTVLTVFCDQYAIYGGSTDAHVMGSYVSYALAGDEISFLYTDTTDHYAYLTRSTQTGLNPGTIYSSSVYNGTSLIYITFDGSVCQTFGDIIDTYNAALTGIAQTSIDAYGRLKLETTQGIIGDPNDPATWLYFNLNYTGPYGSGNESQNAGNPGLYHSGLSPTNTYIRYVFEDGVILKPISGQVALYNGGTSFYPSLYLNVLGDSAGATPTAADLYISSTAQIPTTDTNKHHIIFAWDLTNGFYQVFVDGVDATDTGGSGIFNGSAVSNLYVQWSLTSAEYPVKATEITVGDYGDMCLLELYVNTQEYLDLSTNISKFYNNGSPANLGSDGSLPTGTAPSYYLKLNPTSPGTNSSGRGDTTIVYAAGVSTPTSCS